MNQYDVFVIGGGLLGCFVARNLSRYALKTALCEQREDVCTGISKSNSAIVYSGCDTPPGTLKTRLCVESNRNFSALCRDLDVPFHRCGSLMLSFGPRADGVLEKKLQNGIAGGVPGLQIIRRSEILAMEPMISPDVRSALYAPSTGVTDPWALCFAAAENARANGVEFFLNTRIQSIRKETGGYVLVSEKQEYHTKTVVNCGGLSADALSEMVDLPSVRILPDKAEYFVLDTTARFALRHVLFHEPERKDKNKDKNTHREKKDKKDKGKGKGLTMVPTTDGHLLVGPTSTYAADKEDGAVTARGMAFLRELASQVIPGVPMTEVIRSFSALRPHPFYMEQDQRGNWIPSEEKIRDFIIRQPERLPGFWSLVGIKTPGLTCADTLGAYVARQVCDFLGNIPRNTAFSPIRKVPPRFADCGAQEKAALAAKNPAYGSLVCRCGMVTEAEIIDAIRRGAVTVDGVKRRSGACMGRCQGSFCTERILKILSRELSLSAPELCKDAPGSWMVLEDGNYHV